MEGQAQLDSKELQTTDEIDLLAFLSPLIARWKLLLAVTLLGAVSGFVISKVLPKTYQSSATIYVQQSGGVSFLRDLPIPIGSSGGTSSGYLLSLLQSSTLSKIVSDRLKVEKNPNYMANCVNIQENKNGSITVLAKAHDPKLAADIVNTMLDNLSSLVVTASKRKAEFIAQKIEETTRNLSRAEDRLKDFMEKNDVTAVEEDAKSLIQQSAELDAKLLSVNQELESVKSELGNVGDLNTLVDQEVRKRSLESARDYVVKKREEMRARISKLPAVGAQYARLQRDVMVLSKTYELLVEQYQIASITRKGEDGDYQIIDRAKPNRKKIAPRTTVNTALGGMLCFFITAMSISVRISADKYKTRYKGVTGRRTVEHV
ncbi:MAG: Wzz/FepE/Etk N-terminal domain-containing protein [Armatimonadetes bacterium]|nr:Wzz/FepE/Etk N-terminal domain-containing protein [Armatimonadota bacterium]